MREAGAEGLTYANASNVVGGPTGKELLPLLVEAVDSKSAQVLTDVTAYNLMTAHARTLLGPDATSPPGVGETRPSV